MKPCKTLLINTPYILQMYKEIRKRKREKSQDIKLAQVDYSSTIDKVVGYEKSCSCQGQFKRQHARKICLLVDYGMFLGKNLQKEEFKEWNYYY